MKTVLIAEDNHSCRELYASILSKQNYKVLTASDGDEAVNIFKEKQSEISCVITDILMPNKEGLQLILDIRKICKDVKIIAISSLNETYLKWAEDMGADLSLNKPIGPEFLNKINSVL